MSRAERIYAALPVPVQNAACTFEGFRRSRQRFTRHFHACLTEWERTLDADIHVLHGIQRKRLDRLIEHARAHVPHYRDLPPPMQGRDDRDAIARTLARIEPLAKAAYRDRPEDFLARNLSPRTLIRGKTSGTTGTALPLWWTREALAEEFASFWRGRRSYGARLDDPNLTFNGQIIVPHPQLEPPFWRRNHWNRQTLFSLYHASPRNLPAYVDAIHSLPARYVQGYPSAMHLVATAMLEAGRPLPPDRLVACFTSSESLLAFQRDTIERAFGAPVHDRYGVSEFCVSMTQCRAERLHVDMEYGIVEVEVEEETDEWVRGPLLVTGLANDATPLIRYRIGDIGTRSKTPCSCGRAGDVFLDVDGRIEDYVATPDGRLVGRLDHVFKDQLDVAEAQVLQEDTSGITVLVVRRDSYDASSEGKLLDAFRSRLGADIRVELRYVDAIPREANGKFRAVKSKVGRIDR
jgi:phenylacetate-CoA ligase